jgi:predicted  nucleic acid-binding Zn-ribbon protein
MTIKTTVEEIRALLQLAELDAQARGRPLEAHAGRREACRRRVAEALLDRYQAVLEAGRYPVIVAIQAGRCSGCHVRLPVMVESQARRGPAVLTCPSCRRMLYAPDLLGEKGSLGAGAAKKGARPSGRPVPSPGK